MRVLNLRVLFCPAHYLYDESREGSELSWAYNIADRIGSLFPTSVVVTGKSTASAKRYRILELTPEKARLDFGPMHAFSFNAKYTLAAFRALHGSRFDVVHHVLPFAIGRTYNLAALRYGSETPFVIGPVQPPLRVPDTDLDPTNLRNYASARHTRLECLRTSVFQTIGALASDIIAPLALSRLSRRTLARAAAVVVVNHEARTLLIRSGISPRRVVVIPPGVDTKRFEPIEGPPSGAGGVQLLSVCHLVKRKNVDVIIRAFASLVKAAPEAKLRIVGDGPEREALTRQAHTLGVHESVVFAGVVPHAAVHSEYQRADVFLNASAAESFGSTCLEALAAGLPVVSTRVGEFANAVEDHRNGYLLDRPDPEEFAAALRRLVVNPSLIEELSRSARALAVHKFDWDTAIIPKYLEAYEHVTSERARQSAMSSSG